MTFYERQEARYSRAFALGISFAILFFWSFLSEAQTVIRVNTSTGSPCVATPSGVISSKYCEDGDDGTAAIPLTWATIPPYTGLVEGAGGGPQCRDAFQYLTQPNPATAVISLVGSVTNFSLGGTGSDDVCYDDSGVSSGTLILRATRGAETSDSLPFAVSSVADSGADSTAPTIPTGVTAALDGSNDPVISFDASSDVCVSGQDCSGLSTFTVSRGATALTPTAYTGTGLSPTFTGADVSDLSPDGTSTQSGANWTLTSEGTTDGSNDQFRLLSTSVTGDFTATVKVASFADEASGARIGLIAREQTGALRRYFSARLLPSTFAVRGHYRAVAESTSPVSSGLAQYTAVPVWMQIQRTDNDWVARASSDGNAWGEVLALNLGLNATLDVGVMAFSASDGNPITVEFEQLSVTTRGRQSYTDTGAAGGTTPGYVVKAKDVIGNESAASAAVSIDVPADPDPPTESDTPDYVDPVAGVTVGTQTVVPVANNAALAAALTAANCGDIISLANGNYTTAQTMSKVCAATAPITLTCENPLVCQFTAGGISLTGTRNIVTGIKFNGAAAKVSCGGTNNKIIGNEFTGWTNGQAITPTGGTDCEIAFNEFHDFGAYPPGTNGGAQGQRIGVRVHKTATDTWLHHNYYHDFGDKPDPNNYGSGQSDAIEICNTGADAATNSGTYIERELIEDHLQGQGKGSGTIDWKCGGGVNRYVTFRRVAGRLDARAATNPIIFEGNYLTESGGMQIRGNSHIFAGNYIRGGGTTVTNAGAPNILSIMSGDSACTNAANNSREAACNARVEGNDVPTLRIGHDNSANNDDAVNATNTVVRAHTGAITCDKQTGTDGACGDAANPTALYQFIPATPLDPDDVGPDALSLTSVPGYSVAEFAAWKAARGL